MSLSTKRSLLFLLVVLVIYLGVAAYLTVELNKNIAGPWTMSFSFRALEAATLGGGALLGAFVALALSRPKRLPSKVATINLAVLYVCLAAITSAWVYAKLGPILSGLTNAVVAYLVLRYLGRLRLEPIYLWMEPRPQVLRPLALIGVPVALAVSKFFVAELAESWTEPVPMFVLWGALVAPCIAVGSMAIKMLVRSSLTKRFIYRLLYVGGMVAVSVSVLNPGFFIPESASDSRAQFFPGTGDADQFRERWYGSFLSGLREEPLCCGPSRSVEVYRFTWLRSFEHPVVIRLERTSKERWVLRAKVSSGAGGYEVGRLGMEVVRSLSLTTATHLRDSMGISRDIWKGSGGAGLDGAQWIFESRVGNDYRSVDLWSPDSGPGRDVGLEFMAASGCNFGKLY